MNTLWYLALGAVLLGMYFWCTAIVRRRIRVAEALAGIDVSFNNGTI